MGIVLTLAFYSFCDVCVMNSCVESVWHTVSFDYRCLLLMLLLQMEGLSACMCSHGEGEKGVINERGYLLH